MKTRIRIITTFVLTLLFTELFAQNYGGDWTKSPEDKKECKKFGNNLFLSGGITPFVSLYKYRYAYFYMDGSDLVERINEPQTAMNILEFEANFRYNIFNYRDFFSISATVAPALGLQDQGAGVLCINTPISLDLNFFNHSTFNNIDNVGFAISGGWQRHNIKPTNESYRIIDENIKWNDIFGRFTLKYRKYKSTFSPNYKPNKYYYSYFAVQYGFSNQSIALENGEVYDDKFTHFKIVFGKIFRY